MPISTCFSSELSGYVNALCIFWKLKSQFYTDFSTGYPTGYPQLYSIVSINLNNFLIKGY